MKVGGHSGLTVTLHDEQGQSQSEIGPATPSVASSVGSPEHSHPAAQGDISPPGSPHSAGHTQPPRVTLAQLLLQERQTEPPAVRERSGKPTLGELFAQTRDEFAAPSADQPDKPEGIKGNKGKKSRLGKSWGAFKRALHITPAPRQTQAVAETHTLAAMPAVTTIPAQATATTADEPARPTTPAVRPPPPAGLREQQIRADSENLFGSVWEAAAVADSSAATAADPVAYLRDPMLKAAKGAAKNGTVSAENIYSKGNMFNSIDLGGDNIFKAQADMIRAAKQEVLLQTFQWEPNSKGANMLLNALHDLAATHLGADPLSKVSGADGQPIKVRILVDELGDVAFKKMWPEAVKPDIANPRVLLGLDQSNADPRHEQLLHKFDFEVRTYKHQLINSLHSKTLVVDGRHAALTGANVQERNHPAEHGRDVVKFFDVGITLAGPAAKGLREDFVFSWNKASNPRLPTHALSAQAPANSIAWDSEGGEMAVLTKQPNINPLNTRVDNPQDQAILAAVRHARERIQILSPNFNTPALEKALIKAADRGVKVEILTTSFANRDRLDNSVTGRSNPQAYQHLLKQAKHPENIDLRYFSSLEPLLPNQYQSAQDWEDMNELQPVGSHAKLMIIDNKVAITGSGNMDKTSWHFTGEANVALFDPQSAAALQDKAFAPLWQAAQRAPRM
ncbi:phospholipase D-like domain-containing protein [Pokkaliibacter sp. MBI-7]|uniref:phospholipase D-like domain-containing protein n=1 Tax=Pokkaliibacter sp. MBI-7 TaxID=3040600 RepID=UPI00244830A4|nr:phosphatidylserine/phosphatidylglycerophosphate/cardiolipin synthase family protein [Pokkaliibacter sp. MBI-7]MDH2431359.1 phospholipase D-like domain-containing protein [Pokkaliibacter sp. MBI-7]